MSVEVTPRSARVIGRRVVRARSARYALLTVLAFIVLFPLYITVVNSLLTPDADHARSRRSSSRPTRSGAATATRGTPGTWPTYLKNSFIVTVDHHRRAGRHRDPRRVRVRVPRVPVQAHAVRRVPRDADGAVRGHDRHQRHDDQRPRLVQHLRRARGAVPRHRLRRVPDAPGVPQVPRDLRTPPRSTATATGGS